MLALVIYLAFLAAGIAVQRQLPVVFLPDILRYLLGPLLLGAGVVVLLSVFGEMRNAGASFGVGKPTNVLLTGGPYRFSRNPGYLALALLYAGTGILLDSPWILLLLIPAMLLVHFALIIREEHHLAHTFGREYRIQKKRVRRWL